MTNQTTNENFKILDYEFFSYDIVDHNTLLIKFDLTHTVFYQHSQFVYNAHLFISKIPLINWKITVEPFLGTLETEVEGTIIDHFTFCLVLQPSPNQSKLDQISSGENNRTIYEDFYRVFIDNEQPHLVHYCTKLGPDEDRHRHRLKQGTEGDRVLLVLQLLMILGFLVFFQVVHGFRARKVKEWRHRQLERWRRDFSSPRQRAMNERNEVLNYLQFIAIGDDNDDELEEEKEDSYLLSHERILSGTSHHDRSRSSSPTSLDLINGRSDTSTAEHILGTKPWPRLSSVDVL